MEVLCWEPSVLSWTHSSSFSPVCAQGGFQPFQQKPVVISGRDLEFLWILAQTRLLSTSQGKCTDSLIYAPTFCWDLMKNFMTYSFSSSICWPHCTAIISQQMCMSMGHPAEDKRCGDRSDSAFLSFLFIPDSPRQETLPMTGQKFMQLFCELNLLSDCVLTFQWGKSALEGQGCDCGRTHSFCLLLSWPTMS